MFYAHSTSRPDRADWEPLPRHLHAVAHWSSAFAASFRARKAAELAGLLHDLGKYSPLFQKYIEGLGKSVDHSTAGARQVIALTRAGTHHNRRIGELLAYAIAGHHAGLPDRRGIGGGTLNDRLGPDYAIAALAPDWRTQLSLDATGLWPDRFRFHDDKARHPLQLATLGRMLFSCLVDADFLATEQFCSTAEGHTIDRGWPRLGDRIERLICDFDAYMAGKQAALPEAIRDGHLNRLRQDVLGAVRAKAGLPKGVFTLDVPTGGGKTLTSLVFALEHARRWGMERIIYAIPFTSIIEQTAEIFRAVLGEDMVLEHHSAIEPGADRNERDDRPGDQSLDARRRLAMENWQAPVVVTTNVQLFESLFAHRTSRCRKLHNLANAVIVLDEAQVIPLHVLRPCVAILDELARNYGATIVLCTATQPALLAPPLAVPEAPAQHGFAGGFARETTIELAPDPAALDAAFRRVTLVRRQGKTSDADLVAELSDWRQGLVIVNTRRHALELYNAAKAVGLEGLIHLSTRQTAADRQAILTDVRARLKAGQPCRAIATSLVEAGVDISFPRAWRAMAGLDSIIQAAGRCNREMQWPKEESQVIVFVPEAAKPPDEIAGFVRAMETVAGNHADLFSKPAIEDYFRNVYWQKGDGLDSIPWKNPDGQSIRKAVLKQFEVTSKRTDFAYRTVGENFRLIEEGQCPVIIAIDEAPRETLAALRGGLPAGTAARRLQRFIVQVPQEYYKRMIDNCHVAYVADFGDQFAVLQAENFYNREAGLIWEKADELETSMF